MLVPAARTWGPHSACAGLGVLVLAVAGCRDTAQTIRVDGSSTVFPLTEAVAEEYRSEAPNVHVTVGQSGTGGGFEKFIAGELDICDASREIKDIEIEGCRAAGIDYLQLEVAFDGLAVVIHPENDWAESLTLEQLQKIWRPDNPARTWSDLDAAWPPEKIILFGPGADSGTFDYFTAEVVGEEGVSRSDYTQSEDDNVTVTGVSQERHALGYFGYAYYAENKDRLKLVAIDSGEGPVQPSPETVRDGTYAPLSRPLFIYVRKSALKRPEVVDFVKFYLKSASDLAMEVGYVPVSDEVAQKNEQVLAKAVSPD